MAFVPKPQCELGHGSHHLFKQSNEDACGIAVLAMVARLKLGVELDEAEAFKQAGGKALTAPDLFNQLVAVGIPGVTRRMGEQSTLKGCVRAATPSTPVIAAVSWVGKKVGHFILIEGRTPGSLGRSSTYCICDPHYGLVQTSLSKGEKPAESPVSGTKFTQKGLRYSPKSDAIGIISQLITFSW